MPTALRTLLQPLHLAALLTCLAVALALRAEDAADKPLMWMLLLGYVLALLAGDFVARFWQRSGRAMLLAIQAVCALALVWLAPRGGTAPVLIVVLVAQLAMRYPARVTVPAVLVLNVALFLLLRAVGYQEPLIVTLAYGGFQAFAALTAHYAKTAEQSRDALARVNADLLATRALLADSARDAERLRVARELHDVAGHKLTAMTLNLRALAADPAFAGHRELAVAQQMSAELLGDIRDVVQALRDARGLDLGTALRALAAPLPKPLLALSIDDDVQVTDPATAEAVLRLVQEALTNSARHADAETVSVSLRRDGQRLALTVEDDGRLRGPVHEGNGLAGMRERIAEADGTMRLSTSAGGALRIDASLPL
ncbi:MAG: histidine kinase [Gammaproteobacteria bacterium]|nr:histidine kinase [Gammaproteobacteria bacterium]